ncbi:MAG: YebC/PmpR family DNA-binding transcriptional regulator [bacterium]
MTLRVMSGHSKWSQIKHKKGINDVKKGKLFSKFSNQITIAARQKGGDTSANPQLKMITEKARSFNMPNENIERAIKKGTGELEGAKIEELTIEAYGPAGVALIIEAITDNKNRTVSEIKYFLSQHGGKMAETGGVNYLFERKGVIQINFPDNQIPKDDLELLVIDCGAQDLRWQNEEEFDVYTKPEELEKVKRALEAKKVKAESAELNWVAKTEIEITDEKLRQTLEKLFEALDENDDVNEIYSNLSATSN